jgi:hypothetical protein
MIAMRMRDDGVIHGFPWINVEIASAAIKTFIGEFNQGHITNYGWR